VHPIYLKQVSGELTQVIINIINNAKDALLENKIQNPKIELKLVDNKTDTIINISDNAGGIKDNVIKNIFEPYFTTKHQSYGTGLGLFMSYEIITKSLKGDIKVSNNNEGAVFTIVLPKQQKGKI
jgi:C4-dicarboxylate-specific signal transduction histidine kinase